MTDSPAAPPSDDDAARHARLDALLDRRVAPLLPELAAAQTKYRTRCVGAIVASVVFILLMITIDALGFASIGILGLIIAGSALFHFSGVYRDKVRSALTPVVCEAIGGITHRTGGAHEVTARLKRMPLVLRFGSETIDDVFTGSHDGTDFLMAEIRLFNIVTKTSGTGSKRITNTTEKTVFKGIAFLISTPEPIETRIIIRGPARWYGHRWRPTERTLTEAGYARVAVPDAAFSRHLALWADDGEAALGVVGPGLATTLAQLAATAGRQRIDAAFMGSRFILLLPKRGNSFSAGGLFRPVGRLKDDAHALMDEIMVVHRLINTLKRG